MKPFSALSAQEKFIEVVRWLCVPVAAVAAVAVLILIAQVAMPPTYAQPPGSPPPPAPVIPRLLMIRAFSVIVALAFVVAGAKIAPRYRLTVALVLAAVWIAYAFLNHVLVHLGRGKPHYLDFALAIAAAGGAAALIYYAEKSKGRRQ